VIILSSSDTEENIERGAAAFIEKPCNIEQLVVTAEKLLSDQFQLLLKERERLDLERHLMLASITSLVQALEARDQYTRGHSEEVSRLAAGMAQQMGFKTEDIETAQTAGRLHDLGKIGIRDSVLLKPGTLTVAEYGLIRRHPVIGAKILGPIPSLAAIIPGVLYHHERMNGQGYPEGLAGDKIPLLARIIAVADTYDTLTGDRPYQKGLAPQEAVRIVRDAAGTELCVECVRAFLRCVPRT
jgi:HD-GYP domain-containing protein (c-di-GMP phosphodiesterase class II)